jgi:hypothetical protein
MDRAPHLPPEPKTALSLPLPWRRLRYYLWCIGWSPGELAALEKADSDVRHER